MHLDTPLIKIEELSFRETDTLSKEITLSILFFRPSEKRSTLKGKNLLPGGSKFFPFRVDPFSGECSPGQILSF